MVVGLHAQTDAPDLQEPDLAELQHAAQAPTHDMLFDAHVQGFRVFGGVAATTSCSKKGQAEWAVGFSDAMSRYRTACPKKGITEEDRRLLELVVAGLARAELDVFAALVALRQERNLD